MGTAVRLAGIEKSYGPVRVLRVPELELSEGQVVGLVGENGAGKSTLMGILAGTVAADAGTVDIGGVQLSSGEPDHAQQLGVAMVSQEFPLVDRLSVSENLFLNRRPAGAGVLFDRRLVDREAEELLSRRPPSAPSSPTWSSASPAGGRPGATACCSSATGWTRSGGWPTASSSSATGSWWPTSRPARRPRPG